MRRLTAVTFMFLSLISVPAMAQTTIPCDVSGTGFQRNPSRIAIKDAALGVVAEPDGSSYIQSVRVNYYRQGSPITGSGDASITVPRSAFALHPGTTDCYVATQGVPAGIAAHTGYVAIARYVVSETVESPESAGSNPFFTAPAPGAPPNIRLVQALRGMFVNRPVAAARKFSGALRNLSR